MQPGWLRYACGAPASGDCKKLGYALCSDSQKFMLAIWFRSRIAAAKHSLGSAAWRGPVSDPDGCFRGVRAAARLVNSRPDHPMSARYPAIWRGWDGRCPTLRGSLAPNMQAQPQTWRVSIHGLLSWSNGSRLETLLRAADMRASSAEASVADPLPLADAALPSSS